MITTQTTIPKELQEERFLDPLTDFGFKKLFKGEARKPALIDFLNAILSPYDEHIVDICYDDPEHLGDTKDDRSAVCDLVCVSDTGTTFLVEVQRALQKHFTGRSLYYMSHLITKQADRGTWAYEVKKVYSINLLNFESPDPWFVPDQYRHDFRYIEKHTSTEIPHTTMIYVEIPKFRKLMGDKAVASRADKWLYYMTYMRELKEYKEEDNILKEFLDAAEVGNLPEEELKMYKASQKAEWDEYARITTATEIGEEAGLKKGEALGLQKGAEEKAIDIAKTMKVKGMDCKTIAEITGLSEAEVKNL